MFTAISVSVDYSYEIQRAVKTTQTCITKYGTNYSHDHLSLQTTVSDNSLSIISRLLITACISFHRNYIKGTDMSDSV
jgi:hypothetical protein